VDIAVLNLLFSAECCIFHKQRPFGEWSEDEGEGEERCKDCP
jgi:hypothetical protein